MWLNIYDADPLKSDCADKLKVKEYAQRVLGENIAVPTLKVWDNVDDIDLSKEKIIDIPIEESDYELLSDEEIDNYIKEIENSKEKINEENY